MAAMIDLDYTPSLSWFRQEDGLGYPNPWLTWVFIFDYVDMEDGILIRETISYERRLTAPTEEQIQNAWEHLAQLYPDLRPVEILWHGECCPIHQHDEVF